MKRGEVGENIVGRYGMAVGREHVTAATASPSKCKGTTSQLATSWQVNTGGGKRLAPELQNQNNIVCKYSEEGKVLWLDLVKTL